MEETDSTQKVIYSLVCVCLVLIGGVMSGLTLGLMSLDTVDLEVSCCVCQEVRYCIASPFDMSWGGCGCVVRYSMPICKLDAAGSGEEWHTKREEVCKANTTGTQLPPQLALKLSCL